MDFKEFTNQMEQDLKAALEDVSLGVSVRQSPVEKLQGESYTGLTVTPEGDNVGVNVNLDCLYAEMQAGKSYEEVLDETADGLTDILDDMPQWDVSQLSSYDTAKEQMGASIKIESEPGKGTKVTVHMELPIATKEQCREHQAELDTSYHGNPAILKEKDCRILIAEDNDINAEIIQRLLERNEMKAERACNGQEAVDVRMPVMDGITTAKQIRQMEEERKRNIPIIAITANAFESDAKECLDAGMNGCLAKPIAPNKLNEMIATYIHLEN